MTNEPAERLRRLLTVDGQFTIKPGDAIVGLFDEALAAERRATVERIRAAVTEAHPFVTADVKRVLAILDAEAQR
jgi:hypothetical protein